MRTGLLGGSFNPPHNGHLGVAQAARDAYKLDEVLLLVSPRPPHKAQEQLTSFEHRFKMASLAAGELPYLAASDFEAHLPGTSYTYRTLEELKKKHPHGEFYFLMGADTVPALSTWKNPQRILELAIPVVIPRSGFSPADVASLSGTLPPGSLERLQECYLTVEPVDISSTAIRETVLRGESFEEFVPPAVARYIKQHRLYRLPGEKGK